MNKFCLLAFLVLQTKVLAASQEINLNQQKQQETTILGSISTSAQISPNNTSPALLEFQKANLEKIPQKAEEFFQRGLAFYRLEDYTAALKDFDTAISLNSNLGEAYLYRGRCKKILKDNAGAMSDFKTSLRLNPDSVNYYIQNGASKEAVGDYMAALEEYNKALALNPELEIAYISRGNARTQLGDYASAITDFNKVIQINPQNATAYKKRGYARYKLNQFFDSMSDHEKAKVLYQNQNNFLGYQSSIRSINLLREIMLKNQAEANAFLSF